MLYEDINREPQVFSETKTYSIELSGTGIPIRYHSGLGNTLGDKKREVTEFQEQKSDLE